MAMEFEPTPTSSHSVILIADFDWSQKIGLWRTQVQPPKSTSLCFRQRSIHSKYV